MNIKTVNSEMSSILYLNNLMIQPSSDEDERDKMKGLFDQLIILLEDTQDNVLIRKIEALCKKIQKGLGTELKDQTSAIMEIAQEKLRSNPSSQKGIDTVTLSKTRTRIKNLAIKIESATPEEKINLSKQMKAEKKWLTMLLTSEGKTCFLTREQASRFGDNFFSAKADYYPSQKNIVFFFDEIIKVSGLEDYREAAILILDEIIESLKDDRAPDFSFLEQDPDQVAMLFILVNSLSLQDYQRKFFEPFNLKFSKIPLNKAPDTIQSLSLSCLDVKDVNFSRFTDLEEIYLIDARKLTPAQIALMPTTLKKLDLKSVNVQDVDFGRFTNLEEVNFCGAKNLISSQIAQLPTTLKKLNLKYMDVQNVDFSRFTTLEEVDLGNFENLYSDQIALLPKTLKKLNLLNADVRNVDFLRFIALEEIYLIGVKNLTPAQIAQLSTTLKTLHLNCSDVQNIDFSRFTALEVLNLMLAKNLTPAQIAQLPTTLKKLNLWDVDVQNFDFSRFTALEEINLNNAEILTPAQIAQLPLTLKNLSLSYVDVRDFDFSKFTALEEINLSGAENITPAQRTQLKLLGCTVNE